MSAGQLGEELGEVGVPRFEVLHGSPLFSIATVLWAGNLERVPSSFRSAGTGTGCASIVTHWRSESGEIKDSTAYVLVKKGRKAESGLSNCT